MNKKYPYPFMNQVDPVLVYFVMTIMSMMVMYCISFGGRAWAWASGRVLGKADLLVESLEERRSPDGKPANGKSSKQA